MLLQELVQALVSFDSVAGGRTDNPRKARQRRLQVESLENRSVLAGEVWVEVDAAGDLRITGDDQLGASFISTRRAVIDGEQGAADQFVDVLMLGQSTNRFGQWIKRGFEVERLAGQ